jgi:outer membrane protein assembly factor BamB
MRKAQALVKTGQWKDALELLQKISELPEDSLHRTEAGRWVSLRTESQRIFATAPGEVLEDYRVQFGGLARQLLAEALRAGDRAAIGHVAQKYFHTEAGYEAADRLGSLHLDRGELPLAVHWFNALWQARAPVTRQALWRSKASFAMKQAGQTDLSREILDVTGAPAAVVIAGQSREAGPWMSAAGSARGPLESALAEWPVFYGSARRTGVATGGEPLLLPRWRLATTESHPVRAQIEHLSEDLADQGTTPLPVFFPIMVGGKVIVRTLHGVQVVDADTGRGLWQTDESQPLERLLSGGGGPPDSDGYGGFVPGVVMMGRGMRAWNNGGFVGGNTGENGPLSNLLYRNANFGIVSSDGERLFVVEDPAFLTSRQPANPWAFDPSAGAAGGTACRLIAYNVESGQPEWEVGGPASREPFDPALAGYFFFGAPLADAGDLFVVGESTAGEMSGQIRILCLDARTGVNKWSQLIAASEVAIEKDTGRRWWTAQVAAGDGVLVCPTSVGWLIAVDRVSHSILWGYRTSPTGPRNTLTGMADNEVQQMVPHVPLGGGWGPAPPIIADGRVLYTPPESQVLVCLDENTGKELWTKPRANFLYLAGVFNHEAVLVGRDAVASYKLDGTQSWTAKIPAPAGRAVAVGDRLYVPMGTGEVWGIDLATGTVSDRRVLPTQVASIGNLAMYRGMLLSVDALGLTAFEQRDAVEDEIARRTQRDPRDAWALVRQAEISLLKRNLTAALASLRQVPRERLAGELREKFRGLYAQVLSATIRDDLSSPQTEAALRELAATVATPEEQHDLRRLQAELFVARREFERAFDACLALADEPQALVARDDTPGLRVRSDLWVAGKLADLVAAADDSTRAALDRRISALRAQTGSSEREKERFLALYPDHSQAAILRGELAEKTAQRGDFLTAEHHWQVLSRGRDRKVAAQATLRLARLMEESKLPADAAWYYRDLEQRFAKSAVSDAQTGAQLVRDLRASGRFPESPLPLLDWHSDAVRVERMGSNFSNQLPQELSLTGSPLPFFAQHRFEIEPTAQRLEIIDALNDEMHWSLPLRSRSGTPEASLAFAEAAGHQLTVFYRGVIHSLSPVDRRVLWTRALESRGAAQPQSFGRNQSPLAPMQPTFQLLNRQAAFQATGGWNGSGLGLVTGEYVGYQGRRSLTLLDAMTGEICWVYTGVRPGTLVFGGEEVVYLRPPDGQNPIALRARDGKRLEVELLVETLNRAMHVVGDDFVVPASSGGKSGLRLFDPAGGRDLWTVEFARGTVMTTLEHNRMALLEPDGKFAILDLRTGLRRDLATLSADVLKGRSEVYVLSDNVNLYIVVNANRNQNSNYYSEQVPFLRVNGHVLALDQATGRERWKEAVQSQNLMLERLTFSPYLVFASRRYEEPKKGRPQIVSLHMLVLDKISGAKLLDEKTQAQPGFRSITVSAADRYVELRSYNERVRIFPVDKSAIEGSSGGE